MAPAATYLGAAEADALVGSDVTFTRGGPAYRGRGRGRYGHHPHPYYGHPHHPHPYYGGHGYRGPQYGYGYRGPQYGYGTGYRVPAPTPVSRNGYVWNGRAWQRAGTPVTPASSWLHPSPVVRDHRMGAWNALHPEIPFEHVEALMGAAAEASALSATPGLAPAAYLRTLPGPTMANRQVLPMNTGSTPVPINSTAQITSRPQRVAFRPERVFVSSADVGGSGSAANWIINDITIGNKSQFAQSGSLPGDMFAAEAIDSFVTFETAQTAMDVVLIVTYQGSTEGGTPFYGSIIGTAAI